MVRVSMRSSECLVTWKEQGMSVRLPLKRLVALDCETVMSTDHAIEIGCPEMGKLTASRATPTSIGG